MQLKSQVMEQSKQTLQFKRSIDLGFSETSIILNSEGLCLPGKICNNDDSNDINDDQINKSDKVSDPQNSHNLLATWDELEVIQKKKSGCYSLYDDGSKPFHITTLSETTGIPASLYPPLQDTGAPTIILGMYIYFNSY